VHQKGNRSAIAARWVVCALLVALSAGGCSSVIPVPDQSQFAPLETLADSDEPIARVYVAPVKVIGFMATHTWFVIKKADEHTFDRWEISLHKEEPYGYLRLNYREPEAYIGGGVVSILAELTGAEAAPVVEFIDGQSPNYPWRFEYFAYPGPNCNTYPQWVLNQTGWDVKLPFTSLGWGYASFAPDID
jgi:hypothetical protein